MFLDMYSQTRAQRACEREIGRRERILNLYELYDEVERVTRPTLDNDFLSSLSIPIKTEELVLSSDVTPLPNEPSFFKPFCDADLRDFGYADDEETREELRMRDSGLGRHPNTGESYTSDALCVDLAWRFSYARRPGPPLGDDGQSQNLPLSQLLGWKCREGFTKGMLHEAFFDAIFLSDKPSFAPAFSWEFEDRKNKPHLMFSMKHNTVGAEDFLRGEVLSILATMESRMPWPEFQKHMIVPIMVFSFMGSRSRILQAYYDGETLVLRKSKIFEFHNKETSLDNMYIFLRYLASTPCGDTEQQQDPRLPASAIAGSTSSEHASHSRDLMVCWIIFTDTLRSMLPDFGMSSNLGFKSSDPQLPGQGSLQDRCNISEHKNTQTLHDAGSEQSNSPAAPDTASDEMSWLVLEKQN